MIIMGNVNEHQESMIGLCSMCITALHSGILRVDHAQLSTKQLYVELTRACNLRCTFCYNWSGEALAEELSLSDVLRIAHWFARLNPAMLVIIGGGEPLVRDDCLDILEALHVDGIRAMLLTNGIGVTPEVAHRLGRLQHRVQVSMAGLPDVADAALRGRGALAQTFRGIRLLLENGIGEQVVCGGYSAQAEHRAY